jgi:uncharacterized protein YajQ (UPF0234 family)
MDNFMVAFKKLDEDIKLASNTKAQLKNDIDLLIEASVNVKIDKRMLQYDRVSQAFSKFFN